jgi:hypothetical protein
MAGEGEHARDMRIHFAWIDNDTITFYVDGEVSRGTLFYYRYPNQIIASDFAAILPDEMYYNYIVPQACVYAGMKEPQTQREIKTYIDTRNFILNTDTKLLSYQENREIIEELLRQQSKQ